jgi:hypothetical protein
MTPKEYLDSLVRKHLMVKLGHGDGECTYTSSVDVGEPFITPKPYLDTPPFIRKRIRKMFTEDHPDSEPRSYQHSPGDDDPEKSSDSVQELQTAKDINQLERAITETWISMHQNR